MLGICQKHSLLTSITLVCASYARVDLVSRSIFICIEVRNGILVDTHLDSCLYKCFRIPNFVPHFKVLYMYPMVLNF